MSLMCKPRQVSHSNRVGPSGLHGLLVEIAEDDLAESGATTRLLSDPECLRSPAIRGLVARAAEEFRSRSTAFELSVEGLLLELWAAVARHQTRGAEPGTPQWLVRARDYLHAHFREKLTLADIAAAAGVHPVHLAQVHRRLYGKTVGECVRELRIEFACRALANPELSISRIALDAGFADHGHLTRSFRSGTGLTPSRYRRLLTS
jgi:AraC family transcriptional regulator